MTPRRSMNLEGERLAQQVRALAARMRVAANQPPDLWQDVMDTLTSAVQTVQQHEDRMMMVERSIHDMLWEWRLDDGTMQWNGNVETILGYRPDAIPATADWWKDNIHADDRARVLGRIEAVTSTRKDGWTEEYRFLHANGSYILIRERASVRYDDNGHATHLVGAMQEVVPVRAAEEHATFDALHDVLTGLPNRQLFLDRLSLSFERAKHHEGALFAIIFLDIDRFRSVNESYGHVVGDELLRAVAYRMEPYLRTSDSFARLGSDEFAVLLEDLRTREDALDVCNRIQSALATSFVLHDHEIFVSCTMGVGFYAASYARPDELLRDATIAMSRARTLHPGSMMVFDAMMHTHALERIRMEADLRQAMARNEFLLHYQPIVKTAQNDIVGVEALVRWKHPVRGLIPPSEFIPVAEETGLICGLGEWVLRAACTQAQQWHQQGYTSLYIAVNISARQFKENDIVAQVGRVLTETGLRADALHLELTESTITDDLDAMTEMLNRLKKTGIHISIDDFGMGYSSLSYFKRFPISTVKIDRSFVREINSNPNDAAIATAIIDLAHSLHLRTVAEGVETEAQLAFLKTHRCEAFQGFLCSPALPARGIDVLLKAP